jgi:hypothetical protein
MAVVLTGTEWLRRVIVDLPHANARSPVEKYQGAALAALSFTGTRRLRSSNQLRMT